MPLNCYFLDSQQELFRDPNSESESYVGDETDQSSSAEESESRDSCKDDNGNPLAEPVVDPEGMESSTPPLTTTPVESGNE